MDSAKDVKTQQTAIMLPLHGDKDTNAICFSVVDERNADLMFDSLVKGGAETRCSHTQHNVAQHDAELALVLLSLWHA
jgi:hypothetical protein